MRNKLTTEMRKALCVILREGYTNAHPSTVKALISRGLVTPDRLLTPEGKRQCIALLPLQEQCMVMGLEYEVIPNLKGHGRPEIAALKYYEKNGFVGSSCEGGAILLLIRAAALDKLTELNTFKSREDACTRFTEAQLVIHKDSSEEILFAIRSTTLQQVVEGFKEIYRSLFVQDCYPNLTHEVISALFLSLGRTKIAEIASVMMEESGGYRAGWPDLTLTNGVEMIWAEVKTTDKLHMSQITTISRMKPILPGRIRIAHLV